MTSSAPHPSRTAAGTDVVPACAAPALLPLVDAAFDGSEGSKDAARQLARHCVTCPLAEGCLESGLRLDVGQGVWGGMRRNSRGRFEPLRREA